MAQVVRTRGRLTFFRAAPLRPRYSEGAMNKHLIPREHGAYAQLGFPLLSGLVLSSPGASSSLFVLAAILLFLANEPAVVLAGARGKRLQEEMGRSARRQLALLATLGAVAGMAAMTLAPVVARWLALVPAAFALCLVPAVLSRKLKSLPGEALAAAAFSAMHLPVAAAGGASGELLWGPPVMWFVTTLVATFAVHAIKSRVTGNNGWVVPLATWSAPTALALALAAAWYFPGVRAVCLAACLPLAGVLAVNRLAPGPKRLKQVGWAVVAANVLAVTALANH